MMQVIMKLSREKKVVDDVDPMNTVFRTLGVTEGLVYHLTSYARLEVGTLHYSIPPMVNVVPKTCLSPTSMPSEGVYIYPYMPSLVVPSPPISQVEMNPGMLFTQSLPVQSSDE